MSITGFNRRRRLLKKQEVKEAENVDLLKLKVDELKSIAKEKGIEGYSEMKKIELIEAIDRR